MVSRRQNHKQLDDEDDAFDDEDEVEDNHDNSDGGAFDDSAHVWNKTKSARDTKMMTVDDNNDGKDKANKKTSGEDDDIVVMDIDGGYVYNSDKKMDSDVMISGQTAAEEVDTDASKENFATDQSVMVCAQSPSNI